MGSPEMALMIEKLKALGAKPFHTLTVKQARTQPTPADAVKALVAEQTKQPAIPEAVEKTQDIKVKGAAGDLGGHQRDLTIAH